MKHLVPSVLALLSMLPVAAVAAPTFNGPHSASFTVSDKTEIPNKTLSPGDYTIHVVDHLSDRMILEVDRNGKAQSTFLGLPSSSLRGHGVILLENGKGNPALRGFAFPDGAVAEFVYPKAQAVAIAKANNVTIPAIDPASEGRVAAPHLSQNDMQEVTLWLLTPTPVGPDSAGKPGIEAARYQPPTPPPPPAPQQVASSTAPARPVPPPPPVHHTRPAMAALPHTASSLPLIALAGLLSLCAAGLLSFRRRSASLTA